ncbi:MAG: hypothetical protein ACKV2U_26260 [Bryobacteraceae bacterium]
MCRFIGVFFCAAILAAAQPPDALEREAIALVRSRDFTRLSKLLRDPKFLARLDNPAVAKNLRLGNIMKALAANADAETAALCHALAVDKIFLSDPDRMLFLLNVLGAVKPMTRQTADIFRSTNEVGYFGPNAILLAANGSPAAMDLFESMIIDGKQSIENRIEYLRFGVIPRRTALPILVAAGNILARAKDARITIGVIECLFEYRPEWFSPGNSPVAPPGWETASTESLRAALRLAGIAQRRRDLRPDLRRAVERESGVIRNALARRGP